MPAPLPYSQDNSSGQPDRHHSGTYFFTLGVEKGESIFGVVVGGRVVLNPVGEMVAALWRQIPEEFVGVRLDEFIVMPNHFHAIVEIDETPQAQMEPSYPHPPFLNEVIAVFKTRTKEKYLESIRQMGWEIFNFRLWERGYFERELGTPEKLEYARHYIRKNPVHWARDWENLDWLEP